MTRAGIDLLKSGFSRFGFGSSSFPTSNEHVVHPAKTRKLLVFVIGGITFEELEQITEIVAEQKEVELILGATSVINGQVMLHQLFNN